MVFDRSKVKRKGRVLQSRVGALSAVPRGGELNSAFLMFQGEGFMGDDISIRASNLADALHAAVQTGNAEAVEAALEGAYDVLGTWIGDDGMDPLQSAIAKLQAGQGATLNDDERAALAGATTQAQAGGGAPLGAQPQQQNPPQQQPPAGLPQPTPQSPQVAQPPQQPQPQVQQPQQFQPQPQAQQPSPQQQQAPPPQADLSTIMAKVGAGNTLEPHERAALSAHLQATVPQQQQQQPLGAQQPQQAQQPQDLANGGGQYPPGQPTYDQLQQWMESQGFELGASAVQRRSHGNGSVWDEEGVLGSLQHAAVNQNALNGEGTPLDGFSMQQAAPATDPYTPEERAELLAFFAQNPGVLSQADPAPVAAPGQTPAPADGSDPLAGADPRDVPVYRYFAQQIASLAQRVTALEAFATQDKAEDAQEAAATATQGYPSFRAYGPRRSSMQPQPYVPRGIYAQQQAPLDDNPFNNDPVLGMMSQLTPGD